MYISVGRTRRTTKRSEMAKKDGTSGAFSGVSFGFSKTIGKKTLELSVINEVESKDKTEEEITDISSLQLKNKEKKLVIPSLPSKQHWSQRLAKNIQQIANIQTGDEFTDAAVKEILSEAANAEKEQKPSLTIISKTRETDDQSRHTGKGHFDDKDREIQDEDYEKVDVLQFGAAMLRGMGWKESEKDESSTNQFEIRARPLGLGLGANAPMNSAAYGTGKKTSEMDEEEKELVLKPGAYCQVLSGKMDGLYGTITSIDEDTARVCVTMTISNELVSLTQYAIQLVTKSLYKKESLYLNKKSVEKYKAENGETLTVQEEERKSKGRDEHDNRSKSHKQTESRQKGSKRQPSPDRDENLQKRKKSPDPIWMHPYLRVRFIDEKHKNGKYFKEKLVIIDVSDRDRCICRTENGHLLEDIRQNQLETVIPRNLPSCVMIVKGSHKLQLAEIFEKDKQRCRATVQFLPDRDQVLSLDYDSICDYVGDPENA